MENYSGSHEVGMPHVSHSRATVHIGILCVPRHVWRTPCPHAVVRRVVVVENDVRSVNVHIIVINVHGVGFFYIPEHHAYNFGIPNQRKSVIDILSLNHFHGFFRFGMPQCVKRMECHNVSSGRF